MFAKNYKCFQCGSTLGKVERVNGVLKHHCFVCCAGQWELTRIETRGLTQEQIDGIKGREWGVNSQILPRINTPGKLYSSLTLKSIMQEGLSITKE